MEFIKKMKKREFIEMTLKTVAAMLACFIAIILMEGMIYSIKLNALKTKGNAHISYSQSTIAYCVKEAEDKYYVLYYNEGLKNEDDKLIEFTSSSKNYLTKAECEALEGTKVKEVVFGAPNAFKFSITGIHYAVMVVFVLIVGGYFAYRFVSLAQSYKKIEEEFKTTGIINLTNM